MSRAKLCGGYGMPLMGISEQLRGFKWGEGLWGLYSDSRGH